MKIKTLATLILVVIITLSFALNNDLFLNSNVTSAVSALSQSDSSDCDWPMFGRTPEGNRVAPDGCGPKTDILELCWNYKIESWINSYLILSNRKMYYLSNDNRLHCIDAILGKKIWATESFGKSRYSSPSISKGKVYIGSNDKIYCLDKENGKKVWEYETRDKYAAITESPVISNNMVYFASGDRLYCLNSENGNKIWEYQTPGSIISPPSLSNGKLLFFDQKLYCLNSENGKKVWEYETGQSILSSPVISYGKVYFGSPDYKLYCLNIDNGHKIWEYETNGRIASSPAISNGKVYFGSEDKMLYCLNAENSKKVWEYETDGISSSPIVSNRKVFFGSFNHMFYCLNEENGRIIWKYETVGNTKSSPLISNRKVYVGTDDGNIYCFGDSENSNPSQDDDRSGGCDWPMFGRTPEGNRVAPDGCGPKTDKLELKWKFQIGNCNISSPIFSNGKVFFGLSDSKLYCLNAENGGKVWEYKAENRILASPSISNGKVYFGSGDKKLYCLNAENGKKVWVYETDDSIYSNLVISNQMVLFGSDNGKLYCLNAENGKKIWEYEAALRISSSPRIANDKVFFGSDDKKLYCLNAKNGWKIWEYESDDWIISSPVIIKERVFVGSDDRKMYCLDAKNGRKIWEYETGDRVISSPVISNGRIYFGSIDKKFYCLNSEDGQKVWEYETSSFGFIRSSPIISNNKVYFGSQDMRLYCLYAENGQKVWEYETRGPINSSPIISNGKLIIGSDYNALYCFGDADESGGGSGGSGGGGGSGGSSGNAQPSCCDNCNDCDKCMVFKIGSKDWKICRENQPPMSAAPVVFKGKTFLVVKYIADSIGATVGWDAANQIVKLSNPQTNKTIFLQIGNHKALVNDEEVQIDANPDIKPFISGGRTLLPLRFIADNLGLQVTWVDKTKEAIICFKNPECAPGIDFELNDTEGKSYKLSDYRGRPVLIDFSTSWCGFCIKAMPALLSLHKRYDGRIQFFTVDPGEDTDTVRQFRDELGVSWPFLVDLDESVRKSLNITGYPTMLLLNGKGQIVYIQDGYNPDIEKILSEQFDKLLVK